MSEIFNLLIIKPIYNLLVFFISIVPGHSVALSIILLTVLVKMVLFPLAYKISKTQKIIRKIQPEIEKIRKKIKDQKEQAQALMKLYREHKANPFLSLVVIILQLPILIGLYLVFLKAHLPDINHNLLYSFTPTPSGMPSMRFFGIDLSQNKSIMLALLVGVSQFFVSVVISKFNPINTSKPKDEMEKLKQDIAKAIQMQMKYFLPVFLAIVAYALGPVISLYWAANNFLTVLQELIIQRIHVKNNLDDKK